VTKKKVALPSRSSGAMFAVGQHNTGTGKGGSTPYGLSPKSKIRPPTTRRRLGEHLIYQCAVVVDSASRASALRPACEFGEPGGNLEESHVEVGRPRGPGPRHSHPLTSSVAASCSRRSGQRSVIDRTRFRRVRESLPR
jgi:hypothetical protein